jgi:probable rRNA maturation factor
MRRAIAAPQIAVRNLQRAVPVNVARLKKIAAKALPLCLALPSSKQTDLSKLREIFVYLVSDRRMASIHRRFLHKSGPTDILTFQHGEIFVSVETAKKQARAFGNSLPRELELYVVHGLLHLQGFDDRTAIQRRKMEGLQERILETVAKS